MNRKLLISILICFFGFNIAAVAQTQKYEQQTETKLVILSRPQPVYNSKARKKGIEGMVRLRVTFNLDGEIGDITDVTEKDREKFKKYGLTEQAVIAAKKIEFKPATKDSAPITVTKIVEYSFTLY
jgi:TonB family protein